MLRDITPFEKAHASASAVGENIVLALSMNMAIRSIAAEESRAKAAGGGVASYHETITIHAMWDHIAHESLADA